MLKNSFNAPAASTGIDGTIVFTDFAWSKSNPSIIFASCVKQSLAHDFIDSIGWGIYKSTDSGKTWTNKQTGIPGFKNTWSVDVDPADEKIVYAATNDSGIVKSIDSGESWNEINNGLGNVKSFHSISICPANTMVLLAGSRDGQIFRSEDSGQNWKLVLEELTQQDQIVSIAFSPIKPEQVYAGANRTGFYVSNDAGNTWSQFNDGLTVREIKDITITPDGSAIYAATNGGGIFRLPLVGDALTLTRKQVETPSNAGIDAQNNKNPVGVGLKPTPTPFTTSSSGGTNINVNPQDFSFTFSGKAAHGIQVSSKKSTKTSAIITLSNSTLTNFKGKEILVSTNFPTDVIRITPSSFTANKKRNQIKIYIQSKESLRDLISGKLPNKIKFFLNLELEGSEVIKFVEIPVVYLDQF